MFHYIENLQKKPEHARKRFAFLVAVSVTGIVFLIWLTTLPARFSDTAEETAVQKENSPFSLLGERVGSMKENVVKQIEELRGTFREEDVPAGDENNNNNNNNNDNLPSLKATEGQSNNDMPLILLETGGGEVGTTTDDGISAEAHTATTSSEEVEKKIEN